MSHKIRAYGEWWTVEREYDCGYLGDGSRLDHQGTGEAVVGLAREVMADPDCRVGPDDALGAWAATVTHDGYRYSVVNEAAWRREEARRAAESGEVRP